MKQSTPDLFMNTPEPNYIKTIQNEMKQLRLLNQILTETTRAFFGCAEKILALGARLEVALHTREQPLRVYERWAVLAKAAPVTATIAVYYLTELTSNFTEFFEAIDAVRLRGASFRVVTKALKTIALRRGRLLVDIPDTADESQWKDLPPFTNN